MERVRKTAALMAAIFFAGYLPAFGQDKYRVQISWDPGNDLWTGLILLNAGTNPLTLKRVQLNSRGDCVLRPIDLDKAQSTPNSLGRMRLVELALSSITSKGVLLDDQDSLHASNDTLLTLKVGEQVLLPKPARCGSIVHAVVEAYETNFTVSFNRPYTGKR